MREYIDTGNEKGQTENIKINNLPLIEINIENIKINALLDTGAELSLINENVINQNLNKFKNNIIRISKVTLVNASGKKFAECNKVLNTTFTVQNINFQAEFVIMNNMKFDIILGEDILTKLSAKIDMGGRKLHIEGKTIPIMKVNKLQNKEIKGKQEKINTMERTMYKINNYDSLEKLNLNCPTEYNNLIQNLIQNYNSLVNYVPRIATGYIHHLKVDETKPFKCKTYPIPYHYRNQVNLELKNMLEANIIESSKTNYINPLVIVKKRDTTIRLCLDARKLNEITKSQFDSPQNIDTLLSTIGKKEIFTKLDLKNSFWLIPLARESRKYTGFMVDGHVYQFKVVPFGLQSATSSLVRAMQHILDKYEKFCFHYVDDILVFSENAEEHFDHLNIIMNALDSAGLKLNIQKCQFYQDSVQYLGYRVGKEGISIDKERLDEIKNYPRPKNLKMLRGFLGMLNYYKKFIPRISEMEIPLIELLRKEIKWIWDTRRQTAFENLKKSFHENLLLYSPDFSLPFILRTDASDHSIAAELTQLQAGTEIPICFISRILKSHERRYAVCEKEMAAIVFAITKLKFYLTSAKFTLETDHSALASLMNNRFANSRIYRWTLLIQEFSFNIKHRPGKENVTADALTRNKTPDTENPHQFTVALNRFTTTQGLYTENNVIQSQTKLTHIREILHRKHIHRGYTLKDDFIIKLIRDDELYVLDSDLTKTIVSNIHTKFGHIGVRKTWLIFRETFYAQKDLQIIKDIIKDCHTCCLGKNKNHKNKNQVGSIITSQPLEIVAIDYVSNLITTQKGYKNMLVIIDCFSKYVKIYPTRRCNTKTTIALLEKYCKTIGKPQKLLTDNATYFNNEKFIQHWTQREVDIIFTSIRHPQANPAERYIQELLRFLRITTQDKHTDWIQHIQAVEDFINHTPSTITQTTPITAMLGEEPNRPWTSDKELNLESIHEKVRKRIKDNAERYCKRENRKIKRETKFKVNDLVVVKRLRLSDRKRGICAKLLYPYEGPYTISKVINQRTYELKYLNSELIRGKFHIELLYPYTLKDLTQIPETIDEE